MYDKQNFREVGTIEEGALVQKLPGTDLRNVYSRGTAYVNEAQNIAHLALTISAIEAVDAESDADSVMGGMMAMMGDQVKAALQDPNTQRQIEDIFVGKDLHLFYSQREDGTKVVTFPGMGQEDDVSRDMPGFVAGMYVVFGSMPTRDHVYALHEQAINQEALVAGNGIKEDALKLADTGNQFYEDALKIMLESSLF